VSIGLLVIGVIGSAHHLADGEVRPQQRGEAKRVPRSTPELRDAVGQVAQSSYLEPVKAVIGEHRRAYEMLSLRLQRTMSRDSVSLNALWTEGASSTGHSAIPGRGRTVPG
jgi:hypothetical protein